ncbi:MAG: ABC transporter permease [Candidatus Dadabacteria bacterium]|nr:ABC transporter permease [Candidatus Dadabacteria bacterium]
MGSFLSALNMPDPAQTRGMFRIVTRHKVGLASPLPVSYAEKIRQLDGAIAVTKFNWFGGKYIDDSARNFFARFAVDPETLVLVFDDATITSGSANDWFNDRAGSLVGEDLIKKFGWNIGDQVVLIGDIYPTTIQLTIRAVYKLQNEPSDALFFNRKYLEEVLPSFQGNVGTIWIKCRDGAAATKLADEIDQMFENSPYPTKTESEKAFQMGFVSMLGNVKLLVTSLTIIIVLVILLIAANTMALSARERVREIAVLRTLGFSSWKILTLILGESLILALIGGIIGLGAFIIGLKPLKASLMNTPISGFASAIKPFPEVLLLGLIITLLVGLLSGLAPAIRASQRPITEGLRHVG